MKDVTTGRASGVKIATKTMNVADSWEPSNPCEHGKTDVKPMMMINDDDINIK
jgi:hypothetical protein